MNQRQTSGQVFATACACALALALALPGCETQEEIQFGDASCVAGGCLAAGSTGTTSCTVNEACAVSFANDIYAPILLGPAGCTGTSCHAPGVGAGDLAISITSPSEARAALLAYELNDPEAGGSYIVPCDAQASRLPCNLRVDSASTNDFGECGSLMPFGASATPLTGAQVQTIADWITCGAPDN